MPLTLLDHLIALYPESSRTTLRNMLRDGRILIAGRPARSMKQEVEDPASIVVEGRSKKSAVPLAIPGLTIVFEDADILVADKPHGLITSSTPREKRPTLLAMVRDHLSTDRNARVGLIHRLDRDAAGLIVFTKNQEAYTDLKRQFFHRTTERVYMALVHGQPRTSSMRIESRLVELADGRVHSTRQHGKGEQAITDIETIVTAGNRSLLRVTLNTGRKHQIRVHLSERGHPIVGDILYGPPLRGDAVPELMLNAVRLAFDHPRTGNRLAFEREPHPDMQAVYDRAGSV